MREEIRNNLGTLIDDRSKEYMNNVAIIFHEKRITYQSMLYEANLFGAGLIEIGVKKGDKVAIWMNNIPEWIYSMLGILKVGAILVPINTHLRSHDLEYILNDSDSSTLIMEEQFKNINYVDILKQIFPEIKGDTAAFFRSEKLPNFKNIILLGKGDIKGGFSYESIRNLGLKDEKTFNRLKNVQQSIDVDDIAYIQYTSGTTSLPKGAMLSHFSVAQEASIVGDRMDITKDDTIIGMMPFYHVGGAVNTIMLSLLHGMSIALVESFDPEIVMKIIQQHKCTVMLGIASMFTMMMNHKNFKKYDLSTLTKGWSTGLKEFLKTVYNTIGIDNFTSVYGLSEVAGITALPNFDEDLETRTGTMGKPFPGNDIKIIDPESGRTQPTNQEGEILVRGNITRGYYKKPDETTKAIDSEGYLHTGDKGMLNDNGYLIYTGRLKDMLRVGGENVSPLEVEEFLCKYDKIHEAQVIGVPHEKLGEVCYAFIRLKDGYKCTSEEIIAFCKGQIASFKIPRYVHFINEFPMTGSGKIQKFKLKDIAEKRLENSNG